MDSGTRKAITTLAKVENVPFNVAKRIFNNFDRSEKLDFLDRMKAIEVSKKKIKFKKKIRKK